ncbi:DUF2218 domain-containing protein [Sphingomonas sanguinis]|jgi:hypothetical protein|uniref:DUF2218 domain-containing protein n=1 Tax=Sphingomonas sanguinis TaxID=33051 RepID=A0A7Y7QVG6_9SPHN|nr:DUF2218 domain-containing protein [Sphingomonas sanguinis]MBZ6381496.1 DUF2218 domain-containing protein [Sphingomonas sanguinis]NNG51137.1 DUF2218 domain-containing protein [Sphingomonas sanguinis]NNG52917.1 DUF2218 domain-containing protein [Sphingomonas sanguinis]NVP30798.1 DUF2218 domain-containing protein [Sphingomonas sanguinis]
MSASVARVPTLSASRYLQQLAKHWSHKMEVVFTPKEGTITFPNGSKLEMRASSDTLDVILTVPEDGDVARMREVVSSHLDRFAFREAPLTFDWREG